MKKTAAVLLAVALAASALSGCTTGEKPSSSSTPSSMPDVPPTSSIASEAPAAEGDGLKTGLGIRSNAKASKAATTDEEGVAQAESAVAAVLVDADGKIVACVIDQQQTKIPFDQSGKLKTSADATYKTKAEQGDAYGMKKASSIGKEWYEQAAAFADYTVGKTIAEIKGIAVNEKGAPSDKELSASVTVAVGDFVGAVEAAVQNARVLGAKQGDKLGLGIVTDIAKSTDAGDSEGLAQAESAYAAGTFDADGTITSCALDGSQIKVSFDKSGKITGDPNAVQKTKNEIGDEYGMKEASSIGKEWYEQARAFADYATGKTVAALRGIALTEKGAPADSELAASVTLAVGDFITVLEKASSHAK